MVSRSNSKCYKAKNFQKYALNSQLHALQILTNDDEVEILSLFSFLLAVANVSLCLKYSVEFAIKFQPEEHQLWCIQWKQFCVF